jgi:hypothetical protein
MSRRTRVPGRIDRQGLGATVRKSISDWIPMNPSDGSWTSTDPESVVAATASTSAGVQFQNNKTAFDHHMDNNEDNAGAYFKLLMTEDGKPMLFSDPGWSVEFLIKRQTNGDDSGCINLAVCDAPQDRANRNWIGATYSNLTNGSGKWYVGTANGMNSGSHADSDRFLFHVFNPVDTSGDDDNNEITHVISYANLNSNFAALQHGAKTNITQEYDQGDMVYIMISSGFDVQSTSEPGANTDNTWKIWYRLNYSPQGVDPEYRLSGRGLDDK